MGGVVWMEVLCGWRWYVDRSGVVRVEVLSGLRFCVNLSVIWIACELSA